MKIITKNIAVVLLALIPSLALANGSTTGHNNGHHEHDSSTANNSQNAVVDNDLSVENRIRVNSDNRAVSYAKGQSSSNATGGSGQGSASIGAITVGDRNKYPSSRAASIYTQTCQSGMSAQTRSGGFGVVNRDPLCDYLKAATAAQAAYEYALANPTQCEVVKAEITCPIEGFVDCEIKTCTSEKATEYLKAYHDNLDAAFALMKATEQPALWDRVAGFLIKPLTVAAGIAKFLL